MHPQLATKGNNLQLPVDINSLKMKAETTMVFLHVDIMLGYFLWVDSLPPFLKLKVMIRNYLAFLF